MIETARNTAEAKAERILFSGYGTHGHDLGSGGSADGQNVANISLVKHAGELLALWEGGSAHVIDPETLETEGRKDWSPETKGLPSGRIRVWIRTDPCGTSVIPQIPPR